ncbi:unnamed protein product [Symbiodinium sp. CCMP2592]|nr:unnamed protein product [Symbiodinium sp. CCMP2592]
MDSVVLSFHGVPGVYPRLERLEGPPPLRVRPPPPWAARSRSATRMKSEGPQASRSTRTDTRPEQAFVRKTYEAKHFTAVNPNHVFGLELLRLSPVVLVSHDSKYTRARTHAHTHTHTHTTHSNELRPSSYYVPAPAGSTPSVNHGTLHWLRVSASRPRKRQALHIVKELLAWLHTIELLRQASAPGSNAVKQRSWRKKGRKKKHAPRGLPPKPATVGHYRVPEDGPKKRTAAEHSEQNCSGSEPEWEAAREDLCQEKVLEDHPKRRTAAERSEQNCSGSAPKWEAAPEDLCQEKVLEDDPKKRTTAEHSEQNCSGSAPKWEAAPEDICQEKVSEDDPKKRTAVEHNEQNCSGSVPNRETALEDLCEVKVLEDGPNTEAGTDHRTPTKTNWQRPTHRRCTKISWEVGRVSGCLECASRAEP